MRARRRPAAKDCLQVGDGFDLRGPEVGGVERWELAEALGQLLFLLHPGEERLGAMEGEDVTAARLGIKAVGEAGFGAGGFVAERERRFPRGQSGRNAGNVLVRLFLDADQGMAFGLGLDRADGFGVHEERVVGFAGGKGKLTHRDAPRGREIDLVLGLNSPAGRGEHRVDLLAGFFFRGHADVALRETEPALGWL